MNLRFQTTKIFTFIWLIRFFFIKVLCWGVRNLKRFHGISVKSPVVEIEIGGEIAKTNVLKDIKKNPNFQDSRILYFDVVSNNILHKSY